MRPEIFTAPWQWVLPVVFALISIALVSLIKEPARQKIMAWMIAGAGAAYLSGGGFGLWEMAFNALMSVIAYYGLRSYRFIGIGWLLHTGWDILHQLYGNPILPFSPTSSLGCAIYDPVIAAWFFAGAPSVWTVFRGRQVEAAR